MDLKKMKASSRIHELSKSIERKLFDIRQIAREEFTRIERQDVVDELKLKAKSPEDANAQPVGAQVHAIIILWSADNLVWHDLMGDKTPQSARHFSIGWVDGRGVSMRLPMDFTHAYSARASAKEFAKAFGVTFKT